jgi:CO/xanthine dehydrogenase FAD-binding subunit
LAFGAVGPKVVRSPDCEQALIDSLSGTNGRHEREEILAAVLKRYARILSPIDDQRSTADYRGTVVIRLARHFLKEVLGLSHQP